MNYYGTIDEKFENRKVNIMIKMGKTTKQSNILGESGGESVEVGPVANDLAVIVDIVRETGGATKSQVAESAASGVTAEFDADSVIHALRLLALYDLVTLDGNTWRPGPTLSEE